MKLQYKLRSVWEEIKLRFRVVAAAAGSIFGGEVTPVGRLHAVKIHGSDGRREALGLICTKVVTTAGVNYLIDSMQALAVAGNFKFHGSGTGTTAEATGDTTLVTETGSRATGTQVEGASANIYRTVATITYSSTLAITEHGVFSASTAGTLLDRSVFAAVNVVATDSIEFTYEFTLPAGS